MIKDEVKLQAIKQHAAGRTFSEVAVNLKVHRNTVWRWVQRYRNDGTRRLIEEKILFRNSRRASPETEKLIVAIKEKTPEVTVRRAQRILQAQGLNISLKGIWGIWQRFGFAGYEKKQFSPSYREYVRTPARMQALKDGIQHLVNEDKIQEAATLVNTLPLFPFPEVLKRIPEHLLSLPRQLEYLASDFGTITLSRYRQKAHQLRIRLEKKNYHYSAVRAGIDEGYALMWLGQPKELTKLVAALKKRTAGLRDPGLRFTILLIEGHELATFLKIKEALKCAQKCKTYLRRFPDPFIFMGELAGLYSLLGYYRDAISWTRHAMSTRSSEYRKRLLASLAGFLTTSGDYQTAIKILKQLHPDDWNYQSRVLLMRAFAHLNKGDFLEASTLATRALLKTKKEEIKRFFHLATFILACCHAAGGDRKEALAILRKFNPVLKKYRLEKEYLLRKILLADIRIHPAALDVPNIKLAYLFLKAKQSLKIRDYTKTLSYARRHGLFGLFERLAFFFPEPIIHFSSKGKNVDLPKPLLKSPVFSYELPPCRINFLGRVFITKAKNKMRKLALRPKDISLVIHLSLSRHQKIPLVSLYNNFWPKAKNPSRNLSHVLVRIRKALQLPMQSLRIQGDMLTWNFYFTSDYGNFNELLAQAKALSRAGEWHFARKEYRRAFACFRGMPFGKMYDPWSEETRSKILAQFESEAIEFIKQCKDHDDKKDLRWLQKKARKIVPSFVAPQE